MENMKTSPMFLALLLFLVTNSLAEAINAKSVCNGTVAECNNNEEWLMESDTVRRLLQGQQSLAYRSVQRQPACAGSNGGAYTNNCYAARNQPNKRPCTDYYTCRS